MNCPDERVWFDVAAGTLPEAESLKYVQHAAECSSCSKKLKAATRIFQEEVTPEEEQDLAALPSSTVEQQRKMAERFVAIAISGDAVPEPKWSFWKPLSFSLAGAAVALAVVLVVISFNRHDSPADVEKLLAQAYSENRTIEMRIPGAKHGEIRQQRGPDTGSILNTSASARTAQDKISAGLNKNPDNGEWLVLQAQLDLLDWRYKAALSTLNQIEPNSDSTNFLLTRAVALDEQGEAEHNPQLQGEAVDLLGRVLQKNPNDATALFNQAIVCEKLYMYECASKDWQRVLDLDKDSGWASEAREHINRIQEKKTLGS